MLSQYTVSSSSARRRETRPKNIEGKRTFNMYLIGLTKEVYKTRQLAHNAAARVPTRTRKRDRTSPVLVARLWVHVKFRADFKILLIPSKAAYGLAPFCLTGLITPYYPHQVSLYTLKLDMSMDRECCNCTDCKILWDKYCFWYWALNKFDLTWHCR